MSLPLRWSIGDRCAVRRDGIVCIGTVATLGDGCASVRLNEWRNIFCGIDELELVPLSTPDVYQDFVAKKLTRAPATGFAVVPELHASLFPFQRDLTSWALRRGRSALFADTGLGKTAMQLEWARHIPGDVLILAPLAVAAQTAREGERLGIEVRVCRSQSDVGPGVNITNYDRLHRFEPSAFEGVVLDESSIIKHHDAKTLARLLEAFAGTRYKLCATATPSPNDFTELGTHAEFLGVCTRTEMLSEFFVHDGGATQDWRLKGHARRAFWRWVSSWGALLRKPSDLGYDDEGYDLPPLEVTQHTIAADPDQVKAQGLLFAEPAKSLTERRAARKGSLSARVREVVELVTRGCEKCESQRSIASTCASTTPRIETSGSSLLSNSSEDASNNESGTRQTQRTGKRRKSRLDATAFDTPTELSPRTFESSGSPSPTTNGCSPSKADVAPSADVNGTSTHTDASTSATAIVPDASEDFSAPRATSASGSSAMTSSGSRWPRGTCGCARNEQWIIWCELNDEEEQLIDSLGLEAIAVRGSDEPLMKESRAMMWMRGDIRILVSKPSIFGFGLNFQFCARMAFVGVKDSWESYYQSVRRCWRFGQRRPVEVHVYASELEGSVVENLRRKERDALVMAEQLGAETREAVLAEVRGTERSTNSYAPEIRMKVPAWLREESAS